MLHPRGKISENVQLIFKNQLIMASKEPLRSGTEFWDSSKTLKVLSESKYFREDGNVTLADWPETLKSMLAESKDADLCHFIVLFRLIDVCMNCIKLTVLCVVHAYSRCPRSHGC